MVKVPCTCQPEEHSNSFWNPLTGLDFFSWSRLFTVTDLCLQKKKEGFSQAILQAMKQARPFYSSRWESLVYMLFNEQENADTTFLDFESIKWLNILCYLKCRKSTPTNRFGRTTGPRNLLSIILMQIFNEKRSWCLDCIRTWEFSFAQTGILWKLST